MAKRILLSALMLIAATSLSACSWLECAVLCERFYALAMTNPQTGQHVTCGNWVQKSKLSAEQQTQLDTCISNYRAKGFVLDGARTN